MTLSHGPRWRSAKIRDLNAVHVLRRWLALIQLRAFTGDVLTKQRFEEGHKIRDAECKRTLRRTRKNRQDES
jgi:hypothetical protein